MVEEQRSVPVPDAPIAGVYISGESRVVAASEAFLLLVFSCSLIAFVVPAGDEGCASLPAARSRGRRAVIQEQGIRRGVQEAEGRQGGKAQQEDTRARRAGETSSATETRWPPSGVVPVIVIDGPFE